MTPIRKKQTVLVGMLLAVGFVACPLMRIVRPRHMPDFTDTHAVYRWRNGAWSPAPHLQGAGELALFGEEVWAVTRDGVARFDGRGWRLYPEAVKTESALAIAAGPSGVWVIDEASNLSHFDGEAWSSENLHWASRIRQDRPQLAVTSDGAVWLAMGGLWRRSGSNEWREVPVDNATIAGQGTGHVWVRDRAGIYAVNAEGTVVRRINRGDLPIPPRTSIYRVTESEGRIWLATAGGLLEFNGSGWKRLGIPPGATWVTEVAAGPDGSAWVVSETRSLVRIALWVAPPLAVGAISLLLIGTLLVMLSRTRAEKRLAAQQAVVQAAGNVPGIDLAAERVEVNRQTRGLVWKVPLFLIGFPYLFVAIKWSEEYLRTVWPQAPEWTLYGIVLSPLALVGAVWMWKARHRRVVVGRWARLVLWIAVACFVLNRIPGIWFPDSRLGRLLFFGAIAMVIATLAQTRAILASLLTGGLVKAGEYDRALDRIRALSMARPNAALLQARAQILSMAGKPAEAEGFYRQALAKAGTHEELQTQALLCLGFCLTDQARYDEAQRCFEAVIQLGDKRGSARVGIADLLLAQEREAGKALALLDEAIPRLKHPHYNAERFASKAWALVLLGRKEEAEQAIDAALRQADPKFRGLVASVHWRIGRALVAARRTVEAIDHFRRGYRADPQGQHGGLSRTELQHLGVAL